VRGGGEGGRDCDGEKERGPLIRKNSQREGKEKTSFSEKKRKGGKGCEKAQCLEVAGRKKKLPLKMKKPNPGEKTPFAGVKGGEREG